eukprot:g71934.t1
MLSGDILQQSVSGNCFLWVMHGIQLVATPLIIFTALAIDRWEFWTDGEVDKKGMPITTNFGLFRTRGEYGENPTVYYWNEQCEYIYPGVCDHMLWAGPVILILMILLLLEACFALYATASFKLGGGKVACLGELTSRATVLLLVAQIVGQCLVAMWWIFWIEPLCMQAINYGAWRWGRSTRLVLAYPVLLTLFWLPIAATLDHTPPIKLVDFVNAGKLQELVARNSAVALEGKKDAGPARPSGMTTIQKPRGKPKGTRGHDNGEGMGQYAPVQEEGDHDEVDTQASPA